MKNIMEIHGTWINTLATTVVGITLLALSKTFGILVFALLFFPYIVLWVSEKKRWVVISFVLTGIFAMLLSEDLFFAMFPYVVLVPAVMGMARERKGSELVEITSGAVMVLVVQLGTVAVMEKLLDISYTQELTELFDTTLKQAMDAAREAEIAGGAALPGLEYAIAQYGKLFIALIPAITYVAGLFFALINAAIAGKFIEQIRDGERGFSFNRLRLAFPYGPFVLALFVGSFLVSYFGAQGINPVAVNLQLISFAYLVLHGLSVINARLEKRMPVVVRIILFALSIPLTFTWLAYLGVGIISVVRTILKGEKSE